MTRPQTLTDFRRIGKRKMGRSAQSAKDLHDLRSNRNITIRPTFVQWVSERKGKLPVNVRLIPLGNHDASAISACRNARLSNWEGKGSTVKNSYIQTNDKGRYSSRCSYTHYTYTRMCQSWGYVPCPAILHYRIDTANGLIKRTIKAPKGWSWAIDSNGIKLIDSSGKRDYHPTANDLLTLSVRELCGIATANYRQRMVESRKAKHELALVRKAEREGARVCLLDSIRAGNCLAGTMQWAQRHKLDTSRHYRPSEILAMANGDTSRVAIVCVNAIRRHRREMNQGYCEMSEHKQPNTGE